MRWIDKAERKFGRYAIKNLMTYIISANAIVYVFAYMLGRTEILSAISLNPSLVMQGQIWRLITFIFIPPSTSPIWIIFTLYFYYLAGSGLESHWGYFKFNMYYLFGMIGAIIAAFISGYGNATFINLSLFLAFAKLYPNFEVLVFFVLPVPIRILAILDWIVIIFNIVTATTMSTRLAAIFSIINYFVFFSGDIIREVKRKKRQSDKMKSKVIRLDDRRYIHKCTVCGITENDDPNMEFRYCSKCDGTHEYCINHIKNHEHIKEHDDSKKN